MPYKKIKTPVGELTLVANDTHLLAVLWKHDEERVKIEPGAEESEHPVLCKAENQLKEYFTFKRKNFEIPLQFTGTGFQKKVWNELLKIPFGQTRTYLQIAHELGDKNATRAVGLANGKNPISIIAPCHRVIGSSGKLTGFAGGIENKRILLELEQNASSLKLF